MKFKGTIGLLAVLLAIGLYYFFVDIPGEKRKIEEKELSEKILVFEPKDVEEFELVSKNQTLVLKRLDNDKWELTKPQRFQADSDAANAVLNALRDARLSRTVEDNPKDLAVYGLQEPFLQINLKLKDKSQKSLRIGDHSPIVGEKSSVIEITKGADRAQKVPFYLQKGGDTKVLITSASRKDFEKTLYDMRDKALLAFDSATLAGVEARFGERSFRLARENQAWRVQGNQVDGKADAYTVDDYLAFLKQVSVKIFVEEDPKDLILYGLDNPAAVVSLLSADKSEKSLLIGAQKTETEYYAKNGQAKNLVTMDRIYLQKMFPPAQSFLDKTLLELKPDEVAEISLRTKGADILLARDKEGDKPWKIAQPVQALADQAAVNNLLLDLKETRVKNIVATLSGAADLKTYGLDSPPQHELTLKTATGESLSFKTGNKTTDGKNYFAKRSADNLALVLGEDAINKIFRSLHDLKNRKLFDFKTEQAAKIHIQHKDKAFELQKTGDDWNLVKPEKIKKLKPFAGRDVARTLGNLEYDAIADPAPETGTTGLDKPDLAVAAWNEKGEELASVMVGKPVAEKNFLYANIKNQPTVYQIPDRFLSEIPKNLEQFKN